MVDRVEQEALVVLRSAEVRLVEQSPCDREASLRVSGAGAAEIVAEPQQPLRGDRAGGSVDGLVIVERLGVARPPVAEARQTRRAVVPVRDAVARGAAVDV